MLPWRALEQAFEKGAGEATVSTEPVDRERGRIGHARFERAALVYGIGRRHSVRAMVVNFEAAGRTARLPIRPPAYRS